MNKHEHDDNRDESMEDEDELIEVIDLNHFKTVLFCLNMNYNGFDVELLYNKYVALMTGTEDDYDRADRTHQINKAFGEGNRFN